MKIIVTRKVDILNCKKSTKSTYNCTRAMLNYTLERLQARLDFEAGAGIIESYEIKVEKEV